MLKTINNLSIIYTSCLLQKVAMSTFLFLHLWIIKVVINGTISTPNCVHVTYLICSHNLIIIFYGISVIRYSIFYI